MRERSDRASLTNSLLSDRKAIVWIWSDTFTSRSLTGLSKIIRFVTIFLFDGNLETFFFSSKFLITSVLMYSSLCFFVNSLRTRSNGRFEGSNSVLDNLLTHASKLPPSPVRPPRVNSLMLSSHKFLSLEYLIFSVLCSLEYVSACVNRIRLESSMRSLSVIPG